MSAGVSAQTPSELMRTKQRPAIDQEQDPLAKRETLEFVRAYYKIEDPAVRKRVFGLTKAVAKGAQKTALSSVSSPPCRDHGRRDLVGVADGFVSTGPTRRLR